MDYDLYPYYKVSKIREFMQIHGSAPLKKWGQNFLIDKNQIQYIIEFLESINLPKDVTILEVGSGLGALSYCIAQRQNPFIILEIDPIYIEHLNQELKQINPDIKIIQGDALLTLPKIQVDKLFIIGNLPYYITSDLLISFLKKDTDIQGGIFMVQKEFADRLCKEISSISIFSYYFGKFSILKKVSKGCFYPSPTAESCLLEFTPHNTNFSKSTESIEKIEVFLRSIFWGKRKTIYRSILDSPFLQDTNIKHKYPNFKDCIFKILEENNVSVHYRPEEIQKNTYLNLMKSLSIVS